MSTLLRRLWCWLTGRCPVAQMEYDEAVKRSAAVRREIDAAVHELQARVLNDQRRQQ